MREPRRRTRAEPRGPRLAAGLVAATVLAVLWGCGSAGSGDGDAPRGEPNGELRWPVDAPRITQDYGCFDCIGTGQFHSGIDLTSALDPVGSPSTRVLAAAPGRVAFRNDACPTTPEARACGGGLGNYVVLEHAGGRATVYAHLKEVAVAPGELVPAGGVLALMGESGNALGVHLHFDLLASVPTAPESIGPRYTYPDRPAALGHLDPKPNLSPRIVEIAAPVAEVLERPVSPTFPAPAILTRVYRGQTYVAAAEGLGGWRYLHLPSREGPAAPPSSPEAVYGWAPGDALAPEPSGDFVLLTVTGEGADPPYVGVRSGPGGAYPEITRVWEGQQLAVPADGAEAPDHPTEGCASGAWYRISLPENAGTPTGWVCADRLARGAPGVP